MYRNNTVLDVVKDHLAPPADIVHARPADDVFTPVRLLD